MQLLLIVALPFAGALLAPAAGRAGRPAAMAAALLPPVAALALLLHAAPAALSGQTRIARWEWVPAFGLDLAFRLDGLSLLFALLVLAIGVLVIAYSAAYLDEHAPLGRFLGLMLAFMGGMLGIVLAENLLLLVLFWEITSLASFLLIAFEHREAGARRSALMALTVTGLGGLALLGGALLLGTIAGFDVSDVLGARERVAAHPFAVPILLLIVLAAFTKSAQLPLHFWLPAAMVAPTPVSAYLHSAALVKAGIYLLARMWPVLSGHELWTPLVAGTGLATMIVAAWLALRQSDIKGLLAYSTISHLGMITMLLGLGSATAVPAALFHVLNHALFKAPLFMIAGGVDHATGTRDLDRLGGLVRFMPATAATALVATAAMAGLPPLNGYISKEMMLQAAVDLRLPEADGVVLPALATLGALLSAGYAFAFAWRGFLACRPDAPRTPHEPAPGLWLPAAILVAGCVALGLFPEVLAGRLVDRGAAAVTLGAAPHEELALWHGFTLPFALGLAALAGGVAVAALRARLLRAPRVLPDAAALFQRTYDAALFVTSTVILTVHDRSLQRALAVLFGATLVAGLVAGAQSWESIAAPGLVRLPATPLAVMGWAVLAATAAGTIWMRERRVSALVLVSVVGLMVVLAFAHLSAPDLALTQVAVEIVTTVLLLLAIRLLPQRDVQPRRPTVRRVRDVGLALLAGAGAGILAFMVMMRPREAIVAREVLLEAMEIRGQNTVHLVLTDFRAFDTLGEISVLATAALGVFALVRGFLDRIEDELPRRRMIRPQQAWDPYPLQFVIAARLLLPLALLVSVFMFLRGDAHPGGGFVAGLVLAMAVVIQYMAHGVEWTQRRILIGYRNSVAIGVLLAVLVGFASLVRGDSFLTHAHTTLHLPAIGELELGTVLLFDFGVLLTVAGATLLAIVNFGRIETRAPAAG